jgi:hypothetical protein
MLSNNNDSCVEAITFPILVWVSFYTASGKEFLGTGGHRFQPATPRVAARRFLGFFFGSPWNQDIPPSPDGR